VRRPDTFPGLAVRPSGIPRRGRQPGAATHLSRAPAAAHPAAAVPVTPGRGGRRWRRHADAGDSGHRPLEHPQRGQPQQATHIQDIRTICRTEFAVADPAAPASSAVLPASAFTGEPAPSLVVALLVALLVASLVAVPLMAVSRRAAVGMVLIPSVSKNKA
jgi:hypothetical protein